MSAERDEFAVVLRSAVATRGLSLDQLRRALARKGVTVSVATLSYWQSGRSRPERSSSLAAIGPLEECLDLPRGFLASRLPAARRSPRDDEVYAQAVATHEDRRRDPMEVAFERLGVESGVIDYLCVQDRVRIDGRHCETEREVRMLFTTRRDGLDRYAVWLEADGEDTIPVVTAVTNCRVGRVLEFREYSGVAVELILGHPLRRGETTLVEHRLTFVGERRSCERVWRTIQTGTREVVIETVFADGVLPASMTSARVVGGVRSENPHAPAGVVQAHFIDAPAGRFELGWVW